MKIAGAGQISVIAAAIPARVVRDDGTKTTAPGAALVAIGPAPECRPPSRHAPRHDAFFVAQLIAVAQHSPQTRPLRRATPHDAQAAYRSATVQNRTAAQAALRMSLIA
ncbi:MAG: hypothetical protein J0H40_12565 [Rhizobiales bacterium]|nr:hypothetical protein [Hyphomicrobiales bacterium]